MLKTRLGLFFRIAASVTLFFALFIAVLVSVLISDAEKKFNKERIALVSASAKTLADGSRDALVTEDYELLDYWLDSVLLRDFYAYAYLSRSDGMIISHTNPEMVARKTETSGKLLAPIIHELTYQDRPVREVVISSVLGNKFLANAHVAYYLDQDAFTLVSDVNKIIVLAALLLGGLFITILIIVQRQIKPLTQLTDNVTSLSLDALHAHFDKKTLKRSDEIGVLSRAYDAMVQRLLSAFNELKDEENRLRYMVDEKTRDLQNSNHELEAFSHSVSHDLRAPLRHIDGFAHLLLEDYEMQLDDTGKNYLQRIVNGTKKMSGLIDDMLSLSRISRVELNRQHVDLSQLANEIIDELRISDPARVCEVDIEDNMEAEVDLNFIRIALVNLIGNAWKYTSKVPIAKIQIGYDFVKGETVFYISDNGAGFDMAHIKQLFDVFKRLHDESDFPGSGVGLATVKRVIVRHGGRIWAESEPGKGANFYFTLISAQNNVNVA